MGAVIRHLCRGLAPAVAVLLLAGATQAPSYDLVLAGGRVIDPESGLDAPRNLAIDDGRVAAISAGPLRGRETIDVRGLVVAPGFIDLHAHAHMNLLGGRVQAFDGVTTSIDAEAGQAPVAAAYRKAAAEGRAINYGFTASWAGARMAVIDHGRLDGTWERLSGGLRGRGWASRPASIMQQDAIAARLAQDLSDGGLGIGLLLGYAPNVGPAEVLAVSRVAASRGRPVFAHLRFEVGPEGLREAMAAAAETGARWHVCHAPAAAEAVAETNTHASGAVSFETLAWSTGSTFVGADFLRPDVLRSRGVPPQSILYYGRPLRSYDELDQVRTDHPEALVLIVPPGVQPDRPHPRLAARLRMGWTLGSDAMPWQDRSGRLLPGDTWPLPTDAWAHPRSAATYLWAIQHLVLESRALELTELVRAASLKPAQLLESSTPAFRRKGRLRPGADADIVVLDLGRVSAKATHDRPAQLSRGVTHLLVGGRWLIRDGALDVRARPGRPVGGP